MARAVPAVRACIARAKSSSPPLDEMQRASVTVRRLKPESRFEGGLRLSVLRGALMVARDHGGSHVQHLRVAPQTLTARATYSRRYPSAAHRESRQVGKP